MGWSPPPSPSVWVSGRSGCFPWSLLQEVDGTDGGGTPMPPPPSLNCCSWISGESSEGKSGNPKDCGGFYSPGDGGAAWRGFMAPSQTAASGQ